MNKNQGNNNYFLNNYKKNQSSKILSEKEENKVNNSVLKNKKLNFAKQKVVQPQKFAFEKLPVQESIPFKETISKKKITAQFIILIGVDNACEIIKHFNESELIPIIIEIIKINSINHKDLEEVQKKFGNIKIHDLNDYKGGKEFVRILLQKAFGIDKGSKLFIKCQEIYIEDEKSFSFINEIPSKVIFNVIKNESEFIISIILGLIDSKKAAEILHLFPQNKTIDLIRTMSKRHEVNPEVLETIVNKLKQKINYIPEENSIKIRGKEKLIEILKNISIDNSSAIISNLEQIDPSLALEIRDNIFSFDDIINIPKKSIEFALKNLNEKDIAFLLKGSSEEFKKYFFSCVTKRRALLIKEEIEYLGKVKKKEVDEKRRNFINYLKQLEMSGKIIIKTDNEIYVQ